MIPLNLEKIMAKKAKYPWEIKKLTYTEWGKMDFDWSNQAKIDKWIPAYFFRYDNYHKGLKNNHIMKSTFGKKNLIEIEAEIERWYNINLGAYTEIEYE